MTTLREQISADMKSAMRAKETLRLGTVRLLLSAIKQVEVDQRVELDDKEISVIVDKLIKQRKQSITMFRQAQRDDLADNEEAEIRVLQDYLPARLSEEEITKIVKDLIASLGASSAADLGSVMTAAKKKLAGEVDMEVLFKVVKSALS